MKKIIISIVAVLILLWIIIFLVDYSRCSNFKEPIYVVAGETADDGGTGTYYGLGYKVEIEKIISPEYGTKIVKIEMYILDKFIIGAIEDVNIHGSSDDGFIIIGEKQYDFVGTITEACENTIIVEPEEETFEKKSSDKISINIIKHKNEMYNPYVVDTKVKITYNGNIMTSYPAQIVATKIEVIE